MLGHTKEELELMPIGTELYGMIFYNDLKNNTLDTNSLIFTFDYEKGVWFSPGQQTPEDTANNKRTVYFEHNVLKEQGLLADYAVLFKYKKKKNIGTDTDWEIEREYTYTANFQPSISIYFNKKKALSKQEEIQKSVDEKLKTIGHNVVHGSK